MRRGMPEVRESAEELKRRMQKEKNGVKRQRMQMLYLVASGQARERQEIAQVLGVHRNTVGKWMQRYEAGGIGGLLEVRVAPGMRSALNGVQVAELHEALRRAEGFGSYAEVQTWILTTHGVSMSYAATHKLVHTKLGATLKVARPSHPHKTVSR